MGTLILPQPKCSFFKPRLLVSHLMRTLIPMAVIMQTLCVLVCACLLITIVDCFEDVFKVNDMEYFCKAGRDEKDNTNNIMTKWGRDLLFVQAFCDVVGEKVLLLYRSTLNDSTVVYDKLFYHASVKDPPAQVECLYIREVNVVKLVGIGLAVNESMECSLPGYDDLTVLTCWGVKKLQTSISTNICHPNLKNGKKAQTEKKDCSDDIIETVTKSEYFNEFTTMPTTTTTSSATTTTVTTTESTTLPVTSTTTTTEYHSSPSTHSKTTTQKVHSSTPKQTTTLESDTSTTTSKDTTHMATTAEESTSQITGDLTKIEQPPSTPLPNSKTESQTAIKPGVIAGIIIAVLVVMCLVAFVIFVLVKRRIAKQKISSLEDQTAISKSVSITRQTAVHPNKKSEKEIKNNEKIKTSAKLSKNKSKMSAKASKRSEGAKNNKASGGKESRTHSLSDKSEEDLSEDNGAVENDKNPTDTATMTPASESHIDEA